MRSNVAFWACVASTSGPDRRTCPAFYRKHHCWLLCCRCCDGTGSAARPCCSTILGNVVLQRNSLRLKFPFEGAFQRSQCSHHVVTAFHPCEHLRGRRPEAWSNTLGISQAIVSERPAPPTEDATDVSAAESDCETSKSVRICRLIVFPARSKCTSSTFTVSVLTLQAQQASHTPCK